MSIFEYTAVDIFKKKFEKVLIKTDNIIIAGGYIFRCLKVSPQIDREKSPGTYHGRCRYVRMARNYIGRYARRSSEHEANRSMLCICN